MLRLEPSWTEHTRVPPDDLVALCHEEGCLFGADADFAYHKGGPLTRWFLDTLEGVAGDPDPDFAYTIDSRVHMLKPGWYPCIPGWHLDLIPRDAGGQPDIDNPPEGDRHWLCCIGDCSLTQFLASPVDLERPSREEIVYNSFNTQINRLVNSGRIYPSTVSSGSIVEFGPSDLHRGQAAHKDGWRFFIRCSKTKHRMPANQIRRQSNVYIPIADLDRGW